jgi:hypothetical protein
LAKLHHKKEKVRVKAKVKAKILAVQFLRVVIVIVETKTF